MSQTKNSSRLKLSGESIGPTTGLQNTKRLAKSSKQELITPWSSIALRGNGLRNFSAMVKLFFKIMVDTFIKLSYIQL
jgi:hypothetical protein